LADSSIWARTRQTVNAVNDLFENYQFGEAGRQVYEFLWSDFADWYLEASKRQLAEGANRAARTATLLANVLDLMLRLLHPFTPFVTEALWGYLKAACQENGLVYKPIEGWEEHLIVGRWPERMPHEAWETDAIKDFELVQEIVRSIRNLRSEYKIEPNKSLEALFVSKNRADFVEKNKHLLVDLAGLDEQSLTVHTTKPETEGLTALVVEDIEIFLSMTADGDDQADRERLEKELSEAESQIARLEKLLASPFAQKAPAQVVEAEREKLAGYKSSAEKLRERLG